MLSGVSFQLHLFKAALIPFPDNIHSCASSQFPLGAAGAHHPRVLLSSSSPWLRRGPTCPVPLLLPPGKTQTPPVRTHGPCCPALGPLLTNLPLLGTAGATSQMFPALTTLSFHQRQSFEAHCIHLHHIPTARCITHSHLFPAAA